MKYILKTKHQIPWSIKLAFIVFVFIGLCCWILSMFFSNEKEREYQVLKYDKSVPFPDCSHNGGFYSQVFAVQLTSPPGYQIYYTIDGSEPSLRSNLYTSSVIIDDRSIIQNTISGIPTSPRWKPPLGNVFKGTTLRAICINNDKKSKELIRTFFISEKGIKRYTLAVIAITVNQEDLFDYKSGIYVMGKNYEDKRDYIRKKLPLNLPWWEYPSNYLKRGSNSERPAFVEFYEAGLKKPEFQNHVGLRISGNATRGFSQKSLRISFDKKYGIDQLNYSLFPRNNSDTYKSLVLRNGGNDWNKTLFRDILMQSLMSGSALDVQNYLPSIVFINGEYWGIHNVCERMDENYLSNKYKIGLDSLSILEHGGDLFYGRKKDKNEFQKLLDFVTVNDMSLEENYIYVKKRIDIASFLDGIIANVYFCNGDWPNNNVRFWRFQQDSLPSDTLGFRDGRWRWMLYDTDWGFGYTGNDAVNIDLLKRARSVGSIGALFNALLNNKMFVEEFKTRFMNQIHNNFSTEKVVIKINEFEKALEPEIEEHIMRWRAIGSYNNWKEYVDELRDFAMKRPLIQVQQLNNFLKNTENSSPD